MPCTPMAERASRTSSSLNGLMTAATSFMFLSCFERPVLEGIRDECDRASLAPVLAFHGVELVLGVGALVVRAGRQAAAEVPGRAELVDGVGQVVVVLVRLVADDAVDGQL